MFRWLQLQEILRPRQQMRAFMSMWQMDIRIQPYVIRSGFYGIFRLGHIAIDWPLITSLVERWRPETHTFHVPVGEMTITLQDVAILLGLRIHGPAVTGTCAFDVAALCAELLGVIPSSYSYFVKFIDIKCSHVGVMAAIRGRVTQPAPIYLLS